MFYSLLDKKILRLLQKFATCYDIGATRNEIIRNQSSPDLNRIFPCDFLSKSNLRLN